jgi:hypothetical protein
LETLPLGYDKAMQHKKLCLRVSFESRRWRQALTMDDLGVGVVIPAGWTIGRLS